MNKVFVILVVTGLMFIGGTFYFYKTESRLAVQPLPNCRATANGGNCGVATSLAPSSSSLSGQMNSNSSRQADEYVIASDPLQKNLESVVTQKYAVLFSSLPMSAQTQHSMRHLLLKREQVLSNQFYDPRSNDAEIANNLRKRNEEVAKIDSEIEALLPEADQKKKYQLLKDSTYEQAQLNSFYELVGAEDNLPADSKEKLLLAKLEQKQLTTSLLDTAGENIKNAASGTRPYLIEKMHQSMLDEKEMFLRNAKVLLNEEQFNVLRDYEQQLFEERWRDISTSLASE